MFLKKIHLYDFKGLEDIEISFDQGNGDNRKWTLILGENGTGKSNFLKAIALVTAGSNALGELLGDTDSWIRFGEKSCRISAVLETQKDEERKVSLVINRGDSLSKIISNNNESLSRIDDAFEHTQRNYFVVAYGASRRLNNGAGMMTKTRGDLYGMRSANVKNLFDAASPLNPLTAWILDLDYRNGDDGLDIVKEALNDFLPGTRFHSIDKERKRVLFKTAGAVVPLEQLSDGYQNMASWIGDLMYRVTEAFNDYHKPLEARGLLLIDEIDLHLHPKWQRKLIEFISQKLPNFQVIATTHSPLTAQQAGENELYAFRRNDDGDIEVVPFIGSPKTLLVNQLLMTPVFGIETDESFEVEKAKNEYESLKSKGGNRSGQESERFEAVQEELNQIRPQRTIGGIGLPELDLLERIEQQLKLK